MQNLCHFCQASSCCSGWRTQVSSGDSMEEVDLVNGLPGRAGGRASGPSGPWEQSNSLLSDHVFYRSCFSRKQTHSLASCCSSSSKAMASSADGLQRQQRDQVKGERAFWVERYDDSETRNQGNIFLHTTCGSQGLLGNFSESINVANHVHVPRHPRPQERAIQ